MLVSDMLSRFNPQEMSFFLAARKVENLTDLDVHPAAYLEHATEVIDFMTREGTKDDQRRRVCNENIKVGTPYQISS